MVISMYFRVRPAICQFEEGLGDLWKQVKRNPNAGRVLFVNRKEKLTFNKSKSLYNVQYSADGSNYRAEESDTIYAWETVLNEAETGQSNLL